MNQPLHPEVAILNAALELPAEQRSAYLEQACAGDATLRAQVEALLRANAQAQGFLEAQPPVHDLRRDVRSCRSLTEKPGDRIGRYKLLEQLGEGGCGVVYLAEQEEPVRRRVALKIIKLGMDTRAVIARFEAERQALAMMDHPNIAKVFDAGATETGRPYFVMELVGGVKITEFCEQNHLPTEERLKLFIQVCQAIQHAHQKGVIHRDIKPSNILVTVNDGVPVPKVIDFGIAKATQGRLTDQTFFTAFEQFIGTPAYMSPEQAVMTSLDIDTRSDIYSLGVLLYELLTGRTPFDQRELLAAGLDEMRRTLREVEPLRPSACQSTILNAKSRIDHDLDWIVMKCLEKERARRYETANGLAADVQRHLNHEPVSARPPSRSYRFQKLVRRNKFAVTAAGFLAVALLAIALGSMMAAWRIADAQRAEQNERKKAESANLLLKDTVSSLELQRAEDFFRNGDAGTAVAHLAATLRRDSSNHVAAARLVSALVHRDWALRTAVTMQHAERIRTLWFSPDGRHILSAGRDQTAKIWDAANGKPLAMLQHTGEVFCANYNASGTRIVSASADGTARVWDSITGEPRTPALQHANKVYWAAFSPDEQWVATASADRTAAVWDASTGALKHRLRKHTSHVVRAQFNADNNTLVTAGSHGSVRVWSVETGEMLWRVEDRNSPLLALDLSSDGKRLFSVCHDEIIRLWNLETRTEIQLKGNKAVVNAAFSPDSRLLVTTSHDTTARFWDVNTGFPVDSPLLHEGTVESARFSPDGRKIVTLSKDHSARIRDVHTRQLLCQPIFDLEKFTHADFNRDGSRLVTAGKDGLIHIWDLHPRRFEGMKASFPAAITTVDFSPDGNSLLATSFDGTARVFDARTMAAVTTWMVGKGTYLARFSPDGKRVFTASAGQVQFWDWRQGALVAGPFEQALKIGSFHFNPGSDQVVTGDGDGVAQVRSAKNWQPITPPLRHSGAVVMARFSPDGRFVATASEDNTARVWNARTGEPVIPPLVHMDHVKAVDFSMDGKTILTASTDDSACVWDLLTGKRLIPPLQHTRLVERAMFSPEGHRIITASADRTARIWAVRDGGALTPPLKHDYALVGVLFTRDGGSAMTACWNGALRAWDTRSGQPITESFDPGEWSWKIFALDPVGRRMAVGGKDAVVRLWHFPEIPPPVPQWFLAFAESLVGLRLGDRGQVEFVPDLEQEAISRALDLKNDPGFYTRLARWFLSDPAERGLPPF